MAKYVEPVCKLCRREGEKLFLKGQRCFTPKCSFEKRGYPPGDHGRDAQFRRRRVSDFSRQLREKQKARRLYGTSERQFRRFYQNALRRRGMTGQNLLMTLERRLDNVVFRLGLPRTGLTLACSSPTAISISTAAAPMSRRSWCGPVT